VEIVEQLVDLPARAGRAVDRQRRVLAHDRRFGLGGGEPVPSNVTRTARDTISRVDRGKVAA